MASDTKVTVVGVVELESIAGLHDGCYSVFYKYEDIPHEELIDLWEMNPEYVKEIRPDWVTINHPEVLQ